MTAMSTMKITCHTVHPEEILVDLNLAVHWSISQTGKFCGNTTKGLHLSLIHVSQRDYKDLHLESKLTILCTLHDIKVNHRQ